MRVAMLSPIAWRTPPRHYGPWETLVSTLTEHLVTMGIDVTLFATGNSHTAAKLEWIAKRPYCEDLSIDPKVWECLHIAALFEQADRFDLIHNHFDFLPLTYSGLVPTPIVTTVHGFSSTAILPVYRKYNARSHYVAISDADKQSDLDYAATIHHGIDINQFPFNSRSGKYLLFFGRIHHDKGAYEAIQVAKRTGKKLIIAGIIQDRDYYREKVEPYIDGDSIEYIGSVTGENKGKILGEALALLHLVNFNEPFGLSLVEAMACGTPVIATGLGSIPEIVDDGETGFIVSNIEEAETSVSRVGMIDRRSCRNVVEKRFTAARMAEQYHSLYQEILAKRENYRPWGHYEVISETAGYKAKRIMVYPGQQLSLQKHRRRAEHWTVVSGTGEVTLDQNKTVLRAGQSIDIPREASHRIKNIGDGSLVFIEVQTGDYFGEDDIIRLDDDYGRA